MGEGEVYSMASRDGKVVAALFKSVQPPHWNCYVTVESVDRTAGKINLALCEEINSG